MRLLIMGLRVTSIGNALYNKINYRTLNNIIIYSDTIARNRNMSRFLFERFFERTYSPTNMFPIEHVAPTSPTAKNLKTTFKISSSKS